MRGFQRVGMSTKKDAARPFGLGIFVVGSSRTSACQFRHLGVYFFDGCGILGFDSEEQ